MEKFLDSISPILKEYITILPNLFLIIIFSILFLIYKKNIDELLKILTEKLRNANEIRLPYLSILNDIQGESKFEDPDSNVSLNIQNGIKFPYNDYSTIQRILFVKKHDIKINILWIDDQYNKIYKGIERYKKLFGIDIKTVGSSNEASKLIDNNQYDLIISDIKRDAQTGNEEEEEGFVFLKALIEKKKKNIPTIFYTGHYDYSKGIPAYAFGVACTPYSLLLLVLDILERNIKEPENNIKNNA